jgi:Zn finger protein HypA/HybF involved in hydrogenase expression
VLYWRLKPETRQHVKYDKEQTMSTEKTVGYTVAYVLIVLGVIVSCLLVGFGVLMIVASTDRATPGAQDWLPVGVGLVVVGLVIVALAVGVFVFLRMRRAKAEAQKTEIVQKIDLSGDIELEKMKCQNCGAELSKDSITVKEGAIFIACPYCGAAYQMVEEPKW